MITLLFCLLFPPATGDLQLSFLNIREAKGALYVAVFNRESDFLESDKVVAQQIVPVTRTGNIAVRFTGLPAGQYAISCFHDVNGNGRLDTNFLGIPVEPYGFSNNARPKFRAPHWTEAVFQFSDMSQSQQISLNRW